MWVTVEVFPNRSMAQVAGTALTSAGVPVRVVADDGQGVGLPLGLRYNGAELQVPAEDLEAARGLLGSEVVSEPHGGHDGPADDELDLADEEGVPISPAGLDMGVGTAFKVLAALLLAGLLIAALWPSLG